MTAKSLTIGLIIGIATYVVFNIHPNSRPLAGFMSGFTGWGVAKIVNEQ